MTLIVTCLLTTTVNADPVSIYALKQSVLPDGERRGGQMCYTLEGFKSLLLIDTALTLCKEELTIIKFQLHQYDRMLMDMESVSEIQDKVIDAQTVELQRMYKDWKEENRLRHLAENRPQWGSWAGWVVAGVASLVAAGAVGYAAHK